jgi:hypothetical protein
VKTKTASSKRAERTLFARDPVSDSVITDLAVIARLVVLAVGWGP